jgi:hypothetical protein
LRCANESYGAAACKLRWLEAQPVGFAGQIFYNSRER